VGSGEWNWHHPVESLLNNAVVENRHRNPNFAGGVLELGYKFTLEWWRVVAMPFYFSPAYGRISNRALDAVSNNQPAHLHAIVSGSN
jgi:hypothetical protein